MHGRLPTPTESANFGTPVAIYGDNAVVGLTLDDTVDTKVDGLPPGLAMSKEKGMFPPGLA